MPSLSQWRRIMERAAVCWGITSSCSSSRHFIDIALFIMAIAVQSCHSTVEESETLKTQCKLFRVKKLECGNFWILRCWLLTTFVPHSPCILRLVDWKYCHSPIYVHCVLLTASPFSCTSTFFKSPATQLIYCPYLFINIICRSGYPPS